jgi:hypothetical protein
VCATELLLICLLVDWPVQLLILIPFYYLLSFQSIKLDGECLFDRATEGRFPEVKEIKQKIRDKLVPDKDLGHSDVHYEKEVDEFEDDEAEDQRQFFGVA